MWDAWASESYPSESCAPGNHAKADISYTSRESRAAVSISRKILPFPHRR